MKHTFVVTLEIPNKASIEETKQYISEALSCWRGSLRSPGGYDEFDERDPFFSLDLNKIKVVPIPEPRKKSQLFLNDRIKRINAQMECFDYDSAHNDEVDLYIDFIRKITEKALPNNRFLTQRIIKNVIDLKIPR
jgi:hypothetical protein